MMIRTLTFATVLLLSACGAKTKPQAFSEEDLSSNPAANFQAGVNALTPDRKTGAVDHESAYQRFNASANLGGGPKASYNAGKAAEDLGRLPDAEAHYRKAYEADPTYEQAMFSLARVLDEQGKTAEAVEIYKSYAGKDPTNYEARNDLIAALIRAGQYDAALAEAQEILRQKPDDAGVYRNLSALYYAQGNYSLSQLTAEKALALNAGDPGVYNNMGVTYLIQGNEPAAIEKFKTAIKLQSTNYESNMNLGYVALNSGDYTLAKTSFDNALQAQPTSLDAKLGQAVALRGAKDYKAAEAIYDEIIKTDPTYEPAYFNAATLNYKYTKDFAKAMAYLQAFVDSKVGQVSPTHEVFAVMENVKAAQAAEDEKKRQEAERKRLEEERLKRNEELLATMAVVITETKAKLEKFAVCLDPGSVEEVTMLLEQAQVVIDAKEVEMAPDIQMMLDTYVAAIDEALVGCDPSQFEQPVPAEGAPAECEAPPPAEGTPPPAEGQTPSTEGAPADGAPSAEPPPQ